MADPTQVQNIRRDYPVEYPEVKGGSGLESLPVAGYGTDPKITEQINTAMKAYKEQADALEKRFAEPNWNRVAAGFLKPQLGGFFASLGSANEELGAQQEAARAIAPTVARMRSEIAAKQAGYQSRLTQKEMWDKINAGEIPMNANTLQRLGEFGTDTDVYKAAKQRFDTQQTIAGTTQTELQTTVGAQEAAAKYPYIDVNKFLENGQKGNLDAAKGDLIKFISDKGYHDPAGLKLKGVQELTALASDLQNQFFEKSLDNAKTAGEMVDNSVTQLQNLSTARHLAASPRMDKLLGIESGNTAMSALFNWISTNSDGDFSRLNTAARQLAEKDPKAYEEFQILRKALAVNLATARAGIANPSVASQELLAQTNPDPRMTKGAVIKLLDLQANDIGQNLGRARIMSSTKDESGRPVDPNQLRNSPAYQSITGAADARKKSILEGGYIDQRLPDFYSPYYELPAVQIPGQKPAVKPQAKAGAGATPTITLDDIKRALAQKKNQQP